MTNARQAPGWEPMRDWNDVRKAAAQGVQIGYWGALDRRPVTVTPIKLFKNGKIRVSAGTMTFTLDSASASNGVVYRRSEPVCRPKVKEYVATDLVPYATLAAAGGKEIE